MSDIHPLRDELIPKEIITVESTLVSTSGISKGRYILNLLITYTEFIQHNPCTRIRKCLVAMYPTNHEYYLVNYANDMSTNSESYQQALELCNEAIAKMKDAGLLKKMKDPANKMISLVSNSSKLATIPQNIQDDIEIALKELTRGRYLKKDNSGDAYFTHPTIGRFVLTFMGDITV